MGNKYFKDWNNKINKNIKVNENINQTLHENKH